MPIIQSLPYLIIVVGCSKISLLWKSLMQKIKMVTRSNQSKSFKEIKMMMTINSSMMIKKIRKIIRKKASLPVKNPKRKRNDL